MSQQLGAFPVQVQCQKCGKSGLTSVNREDPDPCSNCPLACLLCCLGYFYKFINNKIFVVLRLNHFLFLDVSPVVAMFV